MRCLITEHDENLKLLYVNFMGNDLDGRNIYQFLFGTDEQADVFWVEDFDVKPAGIVRNFFVDDSQYDDVRILKVYKIKLDLAQENTCFSMQDCRDNCVALAYENLDNLDNDPDFEYPEDGRLVFHFGMTMLDVEMVLAKRNLQMSFV